MNYHDNNIQAQVITMAILEGLGVEVVFNRKRYKCLSNMFL